MRVSEEVDIQAIFQALFPQQRISQGKAVCPFHPERTASLHFFRGTDSKARYHCFGCGAKGDVLDLIQSAARLDGEDLSLVQAIQRLEELTGKKLLSPKAQEAYTARKLQQERMQAVYRFFSHQLVQPVGRPARDWLVERGVPPETLERLPIGIYPGWEEILRWATSGGIENPEIPASLCQDLPGTRRGVPHNLISPIPIIDRKWLQEERLSIGAERNGQKWTGALAFFYGQAFGEVSRIKLRPVRARASEARFLGKEETDIGFFGLSHYQPHNGARPLFVEGEFDVLVPWAQSLRDHGQVVNVFCRSGSAGKTLSSMMALKDLGMGAPILLGDNDHAGEAWGKELSHHCRRVGMDASLCSPAGYLPGEDPAEMALRLGDIKAFEKAVIRGIRDPFALSEESLCPPLPEYARLPEGIGKDACPWLDEYIAFSRKWSPRSYELYHEACGLWLLSTVAARRVKTHLGLDCFTNLYILLIGETTGWKKTTATKIAMKLLETSGLDFLLAPERATPEGLVMRMKGIVPENYSELEDEDSRRQVKNKLALSGRVGWYYEEFGGHLEEMLKPNGFMAQFRSLLRALDDCPPKHGYLTRGHGEEEIRSPYLALLGALTPADLQAVEKQSRILWGDGYFARYVMVVAPAGKNPCRERFPEEEMRFPTTLVSPLHTWHESLGMPEVYMSPIKDGKGRETGRYQVEVEVFHEKVTPISKDARAAFDRYDDALDEIYNEMGDEAMRSTHDRLPNRALRMALIFASLAGAPEIGLSHWAKAQGICERQRKSLHTLSGQISSRPDDQGRGNREEKVRKVIQKLGNPTAREVAQYAHISCQEAIISLEFLVKAGEVEGAEEKTRQGRRIKRFSMPIA